MAPAAAARYSLAASGPRPAFAKASASPTRSRRCRCVFPRSQVQGQAVQLGGAVEGQGLRRLRRRLPVIHPRALVLPGPMKVDGQDLGIGPARGLQHLREASVVALERRRWDVGDHGLADAVVVGLDFVTLRRPGAADQPARPQEVKCLLLAGAQKGGPGRVRLPERPARHGDDLQEAPRVLRQAPDARPEHLVKDHLIGPRPSVHEAGIGLHVSHELSDEERVTARLAGNRRGVGARRPRPGGPAGSGPGPRRPRAPASPEPAPDGPRWGLPLRGR